MKSHECSFVGNKDDIVVNSLDVLLATYGVPEEYKFLDYKINEKYTNKLAEIKHTLGLTDGKSSSSSSSSSSVYHHRMR